jgi:citrate synthase
MTWLTAAEALQLLGVRPQTLYANVSRKKIRAKPDPKDTRRSLYHDADVRRMARQRGGQRKATAVAAAAIEWGDPILSSAISTVVDGRLYYRGRDAVVLSANETLEEVARFLWGGRPLGDGDPRESGERGDDGPHDGGDHGKGQPRARIDKVRAASDASNSSPLQQAFLALGLRAATDLSSYGRALPVLQSEAASVLITLADAMLGIGPAADDRRVDLHHRAAATWRRPDAADIIRRALVLLADHELNASTFATRVAVSTGAPLAAGVLSGLATLSGPLHGRASLGVLELVAGVKRGGAEAEIRQWLSQGRPIAGFGHPLYPQGDPRATALLQQFPLPKAYADLRDAVEDTIGERPNVDFALAAVTKVFDLPHEAPLVLFALGRCVGWLAHALEQVTTGHPIRPRARYIGPPIP